MDRDTLRRTYHELDRTCTVDFIVYVERSAPPGGHGQIARLVGLEFPYCRRIGWMCQDFRNRGTRPVAC
jgi:hypothetical protein